MNCPFCKSNKKDEIGYECGTLDNDQLPRTYTCALNAYLLTKEYDCTACLSTYTKKKLEIWQCIICKTIGFRNVL